MGGLLKRTILKHHELFGRPLALEESTKCDGGPGSVYDYRSGSRFHGRSPMRQALLVCAGVILLTAVARLQTPRSATASISGALRTSWGDPDLQGVWNSASGTPLERPATLAGKEFFTDEELAQAEKEIEARSNADRRDDAGTIADLRREHNDFWFDKRKTVLTRRTSLIVDPPDGKLPPLTPDAAKKPVVPADEYRTADGPEDRGLGERCIVREANGPPILPLPPPINVQLNGHMWQFQIVQGANYVAIQSEYVQQVRIVPLDGRPHLPPTVRQWVGDSRGHWDRNTLVVETTNFSADRLFMGLSAERLRVTERFTRGSADTLDYQFTVDDPTRWARTWTAVVPIAKTNGLLYEFACHEGNYGLRNILSTARVLEHRR